jgi:hypothetical protein
MQEDQRLSLVPVSIETFSNILSKISTEERVDTGPVLVTSGLHPELGSVVLIDSPHGGRVVAVPPSNVQLVQQQ